jgi:hypothetical protein
MDDNSNKPLKYLGKAELKEDIKSGDLLYVKDSFRWGKNSDYAVFSAPFLCSKTTNIQQQKESIWKFKLYPDFWALGKPPF